MDSNGKKRNWLPWILVVGLALLLACLCCGTIGGWYLLYGPCARAESQAFEEQVYPTPIPQAASEVQELPEVSMDEAAVPEGETGEEPDFLQMDRGVPGFDDGTSCYHKLWTFYPEYDEKGNLIRGEYLVEVQSGSGREEVNHVDMYRLGTKAISVIERSLEPEESSDYVIMLGSLFAYHPDRQGCEYLLEMEGNLDGIAREILKYPESRMDQGHTGLSFDNRDAEMVLIGNAADLSESEVERYRQLYLDAHWVPGQPSTATTVCTGAMPHDLSEDFKGGERVGPFSDIVVLQPWWGDPKKSPVQDIGQVSFILFPGETVTFGGDIKGGPVWHYPNCSSEEVVFDVEKWGTIPFWFLDSQGNWVEGPRQPPETTE